MAAGCTVGVIVAQKACNQPYIHGLKVGPPRLAFSAAKHLSADWKVYQIAGYAVGLGVLALFRFAAQRAFIASLIFFLLAAVMRCIVFSTDCSAGALFTAVVEPFFLAHLAC